MSYPKGTILEVHGLKKGSHINGHQFFVTETEEREDGTIYNISYFDSGKHMWCYEKFLREPKDPDEGFEFDINDPIWIPKEDFIDKDKE